MCKKTYAINQLCSTFYALKTIQLGMTQGNKSVTRTISHFLTVQSNHIETGQNRAGNALEVWERRDAGSGTLRHSPLARQHTDLLKFQCA